MSFFIGVNEESLDKLADAEGLARHNPEFGDRFDAIKEIKTVGDPLAGPEFRRVASIIAPIEDVERIKNPDFLMDKRKFYEWLDAHPEYCTYDRRKQKKRSDLVTFVAGKEV